MSGEPIQTATTSMPVVRTLVFPCDHLDLARAIAAAPKMSAVTTRPEKGEDGSEMLAFCFWLPIEVTNFIEAIGGAIGMGYHVPSDVFRFAQDAIAVLEGGT